MTDGVPETRRPRLTRLTVFAIAVLLVAIGAAMLAVTIYLQLKADAAAPRENLQWAAYQLQAEHLRLMLAAREAVDGQSDLATIDERYQIFVSRVLILRDGDVYRPMRLIPGFQDLLSQAVNAIPTIDQELEGTAMDAKSYATIILRHLDRLDDPLQKVALNVVSVASEQQTAHQFEALDTVSYLAVTLVLVVAASIVLAGVTMKQLTALEGGRRKLSVALRRAEESSQAKSRFLAGMSHEMRTPLNAVIGLLREIGHRTPDRGVQDMATTARTSADMLCGLIDDVIDATRIETGKFRFNHGTFDIASLMHEVVAVLASRAEDQNDRVILDTDALTAPLLVSDRARLKQVMINLLSNAIKFTRDGTINIIASTVPGHDDLTILRVRVTDSGIGISAEHCERIFTRFFQSEAGDGLGLGLTISRDIVQRLGGRIGVESELGKGSTFWFDVPVATATQPASPSFQISGNNRLSGLRILVAEDNATNRSVVGLLLGRHGAEFDFAHNGEEAVAIALSRTYDLILMDINMPVMDGLQALDAIRRTSLTEAVPAIALTADALTDDIDRFLAAGMAACVTKPIDETELLRQIAKVLKRPGIVTPSEDAAITAPDRVPASLTSGQRQAVLALVSDLDDDPDGDD